MTNNAVFEIGSPALTGEQLRYLLFWREGT